MLCIWQVGLETSLPATPLLFTLKQGASILVNVLSVMRQHKGQIENEQASELFQIAETEITNDII